MQSYYNQLLLGKPFIINENYRIKVPYFTYIQDKSMQNMSSVFFFAFVIARALARSNRSAAELNEVNPEQMTFKYLII
jgi:hypothetical protein